MMIEASAAITICTRRGWSATAEGQYLGTRRGRSSRRSEPSRDGVLVACNLSAGAAGRPSRGDANGRAGKFQSRGRDRTIQAACPTAWAESICITATDGVAALAPEKAPMVAAPSNVLDPAICLQKWARGHPDER